MKRIILSALIALFSIASTFACEVVVEVDPNWPCNDLQVCWAGNCVTVSSGDVVDLPNLTEFTFQTGSCTESTYFDIYNMDGSLNTHVVITGPNIEYSWSTDCAALPVELSSFYGRIGNKEIELLWSTESEENVDRFDTEFSTDGRNFEFAGMVHAENKPTEYRDTYTNLFTEAVVYVRLKMVDSDGTFEYSPVIALDNYQNQLPGDIQILNVVGQSLSTPPSSGIYFITDGTWTRKKVSLKSN